MTPDRIGIYKEADLSQLARDLIDSYHYETDFLSELLQNAVDAVRRTGRKTGNVIEVEFNAPQGLFTVYDNGTGMSRDDLALFALGRTDKRETSIFQIGEKGVGGSYVLLISDEFEVESVKDGKQVRAVCKCARDRVYNNEEPFLESIVETDASGIKNFTRIRTRSTEFKSYKNLDELINDLRQFTAVGNTRKLFDEEDIEVGVYVSFVTKDEEGREEKSSGGAEFCFMHPAIEYYDEAITFEDLELQEKGPSGKKLSYPDGYYKDKMLSITDKDLHIMAVLASEGKMKDLGIVPTIVLGVKGAPMPVEIRPPSTGYAGYWRNLFVLMNRDEVKLDAGRKSLARADKLAINEDLRIFFNKYVVKYARLFFEPRQATLGGAVEQMLEQAKSKEDLFIPEISFSKVPSRGEELAVVAIFHEMIGSRVLTGYSTIAASSDAQYDSIIRYTVPVSSLGDKARTQVKENFRKLKQKPDDYIQTGFVEFKVDAIEFMRDCDTGKKDPAEVMLLVAYDLSRGKIRRNWKVEPIPDDERIFQGAKFRMVYQPSGRAVPIILLREWRHHESLEPSENTDWTPA